MADKRIQESVTLWLRSLELGDGAAADKLWNRYFEDLVGVARARLRVRPGPWPTRRTPR